MLPVFSPWFSLAGNRRKYDELSGALEQAQADKVAEAAQFATSHALSLGQLTRHHELTLEHERGADPWACWIDTRAAILSVIVSA